MQVQLRCSNRTYNGIQTELLHHAMVSKLDWIDTLQYRSKDAADVL